MGKTYPFTQFYPILPKRFYPVGKTYHANPELDIFCRITGFTSDFLSFIVVELIQFFHRAIHLLRGFYRLDALPVA